MDSSSFITPFWIFTLCKRLLIQVPALTVRLRALYKNLNQRHETLLTLQKLSGRLDMVTSQMETLYLNQNEDEAYVFDAEGDDDEDSGSEGSDEEFEGEFDEDFDNDDMSDIE
jgi:hypothetical protein